MTKEITKEITLFCVLAMALGWLITTPLWASGNGLRTTGASLIMILFMWSPALTAIGLFFMARRSTGVRFGDYFEFRLGTNWLSHSVFHIFSWPCSRHFAIAAPFVASIQQHWACFELDLTFSGFEAMVRNQVSTLGDTVPDPLERISVEALVASTQRSAASFSAALLNIRGHWRRTRPWRAYLLPRLRPVLFGFWKANLLLCAHLIWSIDDGTHHSFSGTQLPQCAGSRAAVYGGSFCLVIGTLIN